MKRLITVLIALNLFIVASYAQSRVSGTVVTQSESETVSGAMVTLLKNDSIPVAQTQTDINGKFSVDSLPNGKIIVRVSAIGYKPERIAIIGNGVNINVGYVYLTESAVNLSEVTVYGSGVIEKVDRYIVLPSPEELERSARSIDLLGKLDLPGLRVNTVLETITVEDRTPVYQVNGRPQSMQRILNINPNDILRIEYSNIPGIRYLERGASGIINIILRQIPQGGSVMASVNSALTTGNLNGGLMASYNYKKSEFVLSYSANWRDYDKWKQNSSESFVNQATRTIDRTQVGKNSKMAYLDNNIALDYTYQPDINTMLSASFKNGIGTNSNYNNGYLSETVKGETVNYDKYSGNKGNYYTPNLDLFFSKKLKNKQSLEFNLVGTISTNVYDRTLRYEYVNNLPDKLILNNVDNNGWRTAGEAVYAKELKKVALRLGVQYAHNYDKSQYKENNQLSELVSDNTYVYGEIKGRLGKASYSLGTGVKLFSVNNMTDSKTYVRNLTTGNILIPLMKGLSLNYVIMYKPTLPSLNELSPVSQTVDDIVQTKGNPDLKPSDWLYNRFLIRYNNNKGFTAALWLKYGHTFNPIINTYRYNNANKMFVSSPNNENYQDEMGIQLNLGYRGLFNHLSIFAECSWNRYSVNGAGFNHILNNFVSFIEAEAYWGNWVVGGNVKITPNKYFSGENLITNDAWNSVYVQYKLKNFYFMARISNIFKSDGWSYVSENLSSAHPSYSKVTIVSNANMVSLGVTYKVNFGKSFNKGRKTLKNDGYESGMKKVE
ncbi:MAG: TonB-dependent receptor [Muribaculaceae bacterium]